MLIALSSVLPHHHDASLFKGLYVITQIEDYLGEKVS